MKRWIFLLAVSILCSGRLFSQQDTVITSTEGDDSTGNANQTGLMGGEARSVIARGMTGDGDFGGTSGDFDVYSLQASAGQVIRVNVEAATIGRTTDSVVGVYNSAGALIDSNDDEPGIPFDSFLDVTILADGVYYVAIGTWVTGEAVANLPVDLTVAGGGPGVATGGFDNYDAYISLDIPTDLNVTGAGFPVSAGGTTTATFTLANRGRTTDLMISDVMISGPTPPNFR